MLGDVRIHRKNVTPENMEQQLKLLYKLIMTYPVGHDRRTTFKVGLL